MHLSRSHKSIEKLWNKCINQPVNFVERLKFFQIKIKSAKVANNWWFCEVQHISLTAKELLLSMVNW